MSRFYGRDTIVYALLSVIRGSAIAALFSNQRFNICSPTMDVGFVKLTSDSFCGNGDFSSTVTYIAVVL
jgi:hypothetical protein